MHGLQAVTGVMRAAGAAALRRRSDAIRFSAKSSSRRRTCMMAKLMPLMSPRESRAVAGASSVFQIAAVAVPTPVARRAVVTARPA